MITVDVQTPLGILRGARLEDKSVALFKGVHYGEDTTRSNRLMPPRPAQFWQGVREALN